MLVVNAAKNNVESVDFIVDLAAHERTFLVRDFSTWRFVPAETVPVVETIGRPSGQARCQGNIYCSIEARIAVGAHLPAHDRFEMIDRVIRQDIERTAGRIAAEESALRATQDLQALKVIEVGEALRRTSDVNAIDIGSHGRIIGEDRLKITLSANSNIGKQIGRAAWRESVCQDV